MDQSDRRPTLTMRELDALKKHKNNLTDAHPRYQLSGSQLDVIRSNGLESFFKAVQEMPYQDLVHNFNQAFFSLAGQHAVLQLDRDLMLCYSASLCIQIIASHLRNNRLTIALLEPAFDNVVGILQAEKIDLLPLPEDQLKNLDTYLHEKKVDAIWVTLPNNPTGKYLSEQDFRNLVAVCKKRNLLLVADFCFRFYCQDMASWDQYAILAESGIKYATIEDSGKTWSAHDLKVGIVQSSPDIYNDLYYYHDNHLLNVSPFILQLLITLINDTKKNGLDNTLYKVVNTNSRIVEEAIADTMLEYISPRSMPVAWLRITDTTLRATNLCELCKMEGVHILPGSNFFWHVPEEGEQYIRISLVRNEADLKEGMKKIRDVLLGLKRLTPPVLIPQVELPTPKSSGLVRELIAVEPEG